MSTRALVAPGGFTNGYVTLTDMDRQLHCLVADSGISEGMQIQLSDESGTITR